MTNRAKKNIQIKSRERMKKHGEVLTAVKEVEAMLDLVNDKFDLPDRLFLEPACGDGNFLTAILKRKLEKSADEKTILSAFESIYGIDLLDDNIKLAKTKLYELGVKYYKKILNKEPNKTFLHKINIIIKKNIMQGDFLKENLFKEKIFDVIIGNPPYQQIDGGGVGDSAKPVYQLFIKRAKKLKPDYITMIIPSRWMKGGKGLTDFRQEMINDTKIKVIHDFENGKICFPDLHIDGGVCYFLWSKNYNGKAEYHYYALDKTKIVTKRFLKNEYSDTVIRDFRQISIIEKALKQKETKFSSIVYSRNPYGFYADLFNTPVRYPDIKVYEKQKDYLYKIYGIKGKKGGSKRVIGYLEPDTVKKNQEGALNYKLFFSKAYTTTSTVPPKIIFAKPKEVCTETFLQIGNFKTEKESANCLSYIRTKFFRALLFFNRHSLNISKKSFDLIPLQDFFQEWTDEKLYKKYGLTQKEIDFIDSTIKPM